MILFFTHGKKILGVKESKPNFTSRMMLFSPTRRTTTSPKATTICLKGYKDSRDYRSKKEEEKEGERMGGDNVRKRGSLWGYL